MSDLLADDFVEFGSSGRIFTKPWAIRAFAAPVGSISQRSTASLTCKEHVSGTKSAVLVSNRGGACDHLQHLQQVGRLINRRLLEVERVSHNCGLSADSIQRVVQPTVTEDGEKAPGLRFGNPRVMALFVALTLFQHLMNGFRNRDLPEHVAALLGTGPDDYTPNQMTYDLRRLLRKDI